MFYGKVAIISLVCKGAAKLSHIHVSVILKVNIGKRTGRIPFSVVFLVLLSSGFMYKL